MEQIGVYFTIFISLLRIEESKGRPTGEIVEMSTGMREKILSEAERIKNLVGQEFDEVELEKVLQNAITIALAS